MRNFLVLVFIGIASIGCLDPARMSERTEVRMTTAQLPAPVRATIDRLSQGGHVAALDRTRTDAGWVYTAEVRQNGGSQVHRIAADGSILEGQQVARLAHAMSEEQGEESDQAGAGCPHLGAMSNSCGMSAKRSKPGSCPMAGMMSEEKQCAMGDQGEKKNCEMGGHGDMAACPMQAKKSGECENMSQKCKMGSRKHGCKMMMQGRKSGREKCSMGSWGGGRRNKGMRCNMMRQGRKGDREKCSMGSWGGKGGSRHGKGHGCRMMQRFMKGRQGGHGMWSMRAWGGDDDRRERRHHGRKDHHRKGHGKEMKVSVDELPAAVKTAVESLAAGGKIVELEKEKESVWIYSVEIEKDGKKTDYEISLDGKVVQDEGGDDEDEDENDDEDDDEDEDEDEDEEEEEDEDED